MTLKAGWLDRQFERVDSDVEKWPEWMKREAAFGANEPELAAEAADEPARVLSASAERNGG